MSPRQRSELDSLQRTLDTNTKQTRELLARIDAHTSRARQRRRQRSRIRGLFLSGG